MGYGLIGASLAHSFSPRLHALFANYDYRLYELAEQELAHFLKYTRAQGLNVTMPYKRAVIKYCHELTPIAQKTGSVNTLLFNQGRIIGHNTDYFGFIFMLQESGISLSGLKVLVLGTGGAARTAATAARDMGARDIVFISRQGEDNYTNLERHKDAEIIINGTPCGMCPNLNETPLDLNLFPHLRGVLDMVYNPLSTRLVLQAREVGVPALGGLPMLAAQAKEAAAMFLGQEISEEKLRQALAQLQSEQENMVLIGMPGCGKSVIGAELARLTGRPFFDTDELVEELAGANIEKIFAEQGEAAFRALESRVVKCLAPVNGAVIATGGGAVLAAENRRALAHNGRFYFIRRNREKLALKGRPLSKNIEALFAQRMPFYLALADIVINNDGSVEETAQQIKKHGTFCP